jgi:aryl-alcohol dehydrogenase-like predicted oxidoreductase
MHAWDFHTPIEETMRAFDDLVRSGKIRYVGISDTPAWKVAQAQMIARFRGWSPVIALQIEYSLVERTVEGELIPMARELGLGVTPWSPLKSGVLSGKYTRANHGTQKAARGMMAEMHLNDRTYDVIDALIAIANELGTTPARVALAWVQGRPGVTSTIIGARSVGHLDANIGALGVTLLPEHLAKLDALTKPQLGFPMAFLDRAPSFMHGGISVNDVVAPLSPLAPKPDTTRY